ncbi:hypothetical protein TeGR_g8045 [Tetraparma gracilis]|uniref:START domain-containing protein n=1 Tax=Tetraparma gracilis TaxID=2962635 RepID=A0ABQ6MR79_9STRA|nr:hypothetical protein TeGR_g8045 [Tetraparma gracilis]
MLCAQVVDAPIAEVAAWEVAKMSRENQKVRAASGGLESDLVKINDHENIYHVVYDLSIPTFLPRQFVSMVVWKWDEDMQELTVAGEGVQHDGFPERKEYLRASGSALYKYKREAEVGELPQTKVTYTQQVDLGGRIPKWVQNRQGIGTLIPDEVLAYVWDVKSRDKTRPDDLEKEIDEQPNDHNQLVFNKKQTPAVISNRDFLGRAVWKEAEGGGFVVVAVPEESTKRPANKRKGSRKKSSAKGDFAIRGTYKSIMKIEKVDNEWTRIVQVIRADAGGYITTLVARQMIASRLAGVTTIQEFFEEQRGMGDYDKADGRALGYRLTYPDEKNKKTPSEAVAYIVKLHKGLSQLSQEYPWIVAFLKETLKGGLHRNKAVSTKLDCLSEAEARRIGKNLPQALRSRKKAEGGVYQWKNQNPSMVELFEKYPWVEEMVLTMGEELLKNAAWGLRFRVITGSGLSMVDLATDINVILVYFGQPGQEGYGWMMLGMVLASMGLQLVLVLVQNGKMGWSKLLREALIVVSGLKPGVDAMRVVSNAEMNEHHVVDAKQELVGTKCAEMFCESIPGCILQVTALIQGGSRDKMGTKVFSIFVSAITTGMSSASISYDFDSDPEKRRKLPTFYGYLPDEGNKRTIMYVCIVINSALLLLLRSIGAALLILADAKIFVAYMAGDHLLYLLLKLVRGDFLYWMPIEGVSGLILSLVMRVGVKTITDFTGVLQFRASGEMGGAMWLWTICLALVVPWVAVPVYFGSLTSNSTKAAQNEVIISTNSTSDALELEQSDALGILGSLTACWVIAFAVFLSLMKKKYRSTFWSKETGNEWAQSFFLQGGSDDIKKNIFKYNLAKWEPIESQVKEWVKEGWMEWEKDKPDWFNDNWKAKVPVDWVPKEGKAGWKESVRRRSISVAERKGSVLFGAKTHPEGTNDK